MTHSMDDALNVRHPVVPENGVSEPAWPPHFALQHCYAANSLRLQSLLLVAALKCSTLLQQKLVYVISLRQEEGER